MSLQSASMLYLPRIEEELQDLIQAPRPRQPVYYDMMRYHLGWADEAFQPTRGKGGKRIRSLLCLLSCRAAGGDPWQALPAACAVELVHSFSLVHDDIEDRSPTRRGRRAVWDVWGVAQAINVGDGLFVLARIALQRLQERGVPLSRCQVAAQALDHACLALCEGQYLDMAFEERVHIDVSEYLTMIQSKTAALLAASAALGAHIATGDPEQAETWFRFGESLGMAFQIQDDILGIWGDERVTGKSAATDVRDRKKTLPVVHALSLTQDASDAQSLALLYSQPGPLDDAAVGFAIAALDRVGARSHCETKAGEYYRLAIQSLDRVATDASGLADLRELAATLLGRAS